MSGRVLLLVLLGKEVLITHQTLYQQTTFDSSVWEQAKIADPLPAEVAPSRVLCAGQCGNHADCDMFSFAEESNGCQLGFSGAITDATGTAGEEDRLVYVSRDSPCKRDGIGQTVDGFRVTN